VLLEAKERENNREKMADDTIQIKIDFVHLVLLEFDFRY